MNPFDLDMVKALNKRECDDADAILRAIGLDPQTYRTEGGSLNLPKIRAALAHPDEYPRMTPPPAKAPAKKPLLHCQNCGLTRITGSGPCDECGADDFRTFDKLTNRLTGGPLAASPTAQAPAVVPLVERLRLHIARMAPHQKERHGCALIIECEAAMTDAAGGKSALSDGLGVCVLARGCVVAWFAEFTEEAREWCTENYFGEWLTWRAEAPTPIPLTAAEQAECEKRANELFDGIHQEPRIAD